MNMTDKRTLMMLSAAVAAFELEFPNITWAAGIESNGIPCIIGTFSGTGFNLNIRLHGEDGNRLAKAEPMAGWKRDEFAWSITDSGFGQRAEGGKTLVLANAVRLLRAAIDAHAAAIVESVRRAVGRV